MKEECNHYWVEIFHHGFYNERWFKCLHCNTPPVLKEENKLMNHREIAPTRAWEKILKARNAA